MAHRPNPRGPAPQRAPPGGAPARSGPIRPGPWPSARLPGRPLVRRHLAEPPQGRKAARVGELWRVHGGSFVSAPRLRGAWCPAMRQPRWELHAIVGARRTHHVDTRGSAGPAESRRSATLSPRSRETTRSNMRDSPGAGWPSPSSSAHGCPMTATCCTPTRSVATCRRGMMRGRMPQRAAQA